MNDNRKRLNKRRGLAKIFGSKKAVKSEDPQRELSRLVRQSKREYRDYINTRPNLFDDISTKTNDFANRPKERITKGLVDWEILPPGWWHDTVRRRQLESQIKNKSKVQLLLKRLDYLETLNPKELYRSDFESNGAPYYVFVFDECVVAENPMEGNAIYIVRGVGDWMELLKLPKETLRTQYLSKVKRIVHLGNWEARLKREILAGG